MENFDKIWRAFFLIGVIAISVQQLIRADFRPVELPPAYPAWLTHRLVWTWMCSIADIAACFAIMFDVKARTIALLLGAWFLLFVLIFQIPAQLSHTYAFIFGPGLGLLNELKEIINRIGSLTDLFKELTISGGFFVVAGSFPQENSNPGFIKLLSKLIPAGKYFLGFTLALFGSMHFVYRDFVATLVPNWIPWHNFWTYFGAVALIAGGFGIMIKPIRHFAAFWSGVMLFIWFIILHIPRAIADPHSGAGNEWTSVFEALAFSGIAFLIAAESPNKA